VALTRSSGKEDASAGIVFRFTDGKYYVVRANALEDNFRLYTYDRGRRQIATATVKPPALKQWHTLRLVAAGDPLNLYDVSGLAEMVRRHEEQLRGLRRVRKAN